MLNIKNNKTIKLSQEEYTTYSKQLILENIGVQGQKRLKRSKVAIIGAGGLGCPVMIYLAISGIGYIGLIDKDRIENSNLNRQMLYEISDINSLKVIAAKSKLKNINKNCRIIQHPYKLNKENSIEILCNYDIIIDATDNFETRYLIDNICYLLHKTYIYGAVDQFEGQIAVFNYKNGIRYNNIYNKKMQLNNDSCNRNGIMGVSTGYIGNLQAIETIKIILGLNKKCKNSLAMYNIITAKNKTKKIYLKREILKHNISQNNIVKFNNVISINSLKNVKEYTIVIDLRKESEFNQKHIDKSINIPISKFKFNNTIRLIKIYSQDKYLMVYCNTLERSMIASHFLKNNKVNSCIIKYK
uniref:Molybdopterin biosynthesis protein n=1 Tax=Pleurostichidium falkenbergii TaxID=121064 RepID=A0A4D6UYM4_9FLOR|nr:Molybdopterin biosynthesis protein [Pleurostichidium falkenbergii]QCH39738.1 Molybdopterin biosynthesis protein [Pleurostichidium falkenbergii]